MSKHKKKNKKSHKVLKALFWTFFTIFLLVGAAGVGFIGYQIMQAPDISEIDATPEGYLTTILDNEEEVMSTLYVTESNRVYVDLEQMPMDLQQAFIAIEDARFYDHHGIDLIGIIRAAVKGLTSGNFSQGASTITQQLLKNNVFTGWMEEEDFYDRICRKIQEQYLAIRLEQQFSKEWILENYLNTINLGGGTRGVQVAAKFYFGKEVTDLTLAESALIAGITKNPSAYNPLKNPEKCLERQQLVLDAMYDQEYITSEEYQMANEEDVISALITESENRTGQVLSWFEDALLEQLVSDLMRQYGYTKEEAWNLLYSGGLTIYSTQNTKLQEICEAEAVNPQWCNNGEQLSMVMTDVSTGAVAAIVGGSDEKTSSLTYNRATSAICQPGSTIKIVGEYAAAVDYKMVTLGTTVNDEPYTYSNGTPLQNSYGSYKGMTTIRDAIAVSGNIVALKTYQQVGADRVFSYLEKFGITTLTEEDKNEALALGGTYNGVTNLEMTGAYNAIANDGIYLEPHYYTKVVDRNGNVILQKNPETEQVISLESAQILTLAMQDVITYGTGTDCAVEGTDLAAKSGTTNDNRDLWFVGFSGYYTLGVWGGFDDHSAQTDGGYVKQIWQNVMEAAHVGKEWSPLVNTGNLIKADICTKCGNLAIKGLCDSTVQGDMTKEEYYVSGTQPSNRCDCHESVTLCTESKKAVTKFCPKEMQYTKIYLKSASSGTEDASYVMPSGAKGSCDIHTSLWDELMKKKAEEEAAKAENPDNSEGTGETPEGDTPDEGQEENESWWDQFFPDNTETEE